MWSTVLPKQFTFKYYMETHTHTHTHTHSHTYNDYSRDWVLIFL